MVNPGKFHSFSVLRENTVMDQLQPKQREAAALLNLLPGPEESEGDAFGDAPTGGDPPTDGDPAADGDLASQASPKHKLNI